MQRRDHVLLLAWTAILAVVLLTTTCWWLQRNDLPNGFQNEADHLYTLTEVYFRLRDNSYSDAHQTLWGEYYPPLNHLIAATGLTVFGRSRLVATVSLGALAALSLWPSFQVEGSPGISSMSELVYPSARIPKPWVPRT